MKQEDELHKFSPLVGEEGEGAACLIRDTFLMV